ncbi:MAG: hypothetical protein J1F24_07745 [Oscillospiraceae bacterium]|nr:hypothetical protein [Oscillospiraceae bacterium]
MKENKKRKKFLVAVLLTVAVAVNVAMSAYICVDKVNDIKTNSEHESTVSDMQKNIDDLQKNIDDLQEYVDTASTNLSSVTDLQMQVDSLVANNEYYQYRIYLLTEQIDSMFTDDQSSADIQFAKEMFEKGAGKIIAILSSDYSQYPMAKAYDKIVINDWPFEKRDVPYSDVVKEFSEIFTGDALERVLGSLDDRLAEKDGYLYTRTAGASGWGVQNIKINKVSESDDEKTYQVKSESTAADGEVFAVNICTMTIKQVDGSYRISEFDYY